MGDSKIEKIMFKNYLKIAWRNLLRNKSFSLLNIVGLSIGLAVTALILIWINFEVGFDRFHEKTDRIYQVNNQYPVEGEIWTWNSTPKIMASVIKNDYPEVEGVSRYFYETPFLFSKDDKRIKSTGTIVDPDFLKMFSFPLIEGNIENTLFGDFPELTNRSYTINKAIANSYKHWKQIKSIKNVGLDIDNMTISVPHYFDTVDANGRLQSFSPHTDFKDDNYHKRKNLGQWTLEIEATEPKLLDNFLNIISLKDPGKQKPISRLVESEQAYGAIIDKTLVIFAKDRIKLTSVNLKGQGKIEDVFIANLEANSAYYITYKEIGLNWEINLAQTGHEKDIVLSSAMGIINLNSVDTDLSRTNKPY